MDLIQIRNGMRIVAGVGATVLSVGAASAFAAGNFTTISQTGPSALVSVSNSMMNALTGSFSRMASATAPVHVTIHAGTGETEDNTTATVMGGSVGVGGTFTVSQNTGVGAPMTIPSAPADTNTTGITRTGPSSSTIVNNASANSLSLSSTTSATSSTPFYVTVHNGMGDIEHNTTATVTGGDTLVALNSSTTQNAGSGFGSFVLPGAPSATNTTAINETGPGSSTVVTNSSTNTASITNSTTASAKTLFNIAAYAGLGEVEGNTTAVVHGGNVLVNLNSMVSQN